MAEEFLWWERGLGQEAEGWIRWPREARGASVHCAHRAESCVSRASGRRSPPQPGRWRHQPELPRRSPLTGLASRGHRVKAVLGRVLYQGIVA